MKVIIHPDEHAPRMFKNKVLERLTWSSPILIFFMYGLLSTVMLYGASAHFHFSITQIIFVFFVGLISWTFAEYILHRFLYHKIKDADYSDGFQYIFHGVHHTYPNDQKKIVLPPVPSIIFATIFFGLFYLTMGKYAFLFTPGFIMGYVTYMWIHSMIHKTQAPSKFNFWWHHHNIHHFQQHDRAFGVSSPLWDIVFGTMPQKNRKTVEVVIKKE